MALSEMWYSTAAWAPTAGGKPKDWIDNPTSLEWVPKPDQLDEKCSMLLQKLKNKSCLQQIRRRARSASDEVACGTEPGDE
jgi:hypothetical protein